MASRDEVVLDLRGRMVLAANPRPIDIQLSYDPHHPFSTLMIIHDGLGLPISWEFARSLLTAGLRTPSGEGDVAVESVDGELLLTLRSPEGAATIAIPRRPVIRFLREAYRLVPAGQEAEHLDIDGALADLFEQESR